MQVTQLPGPGLAAEKTYINSAQLDYVLLGSFRYISVLY